MKHIANIVSNREISNHTKLSWINYATFTDAINWSLPTLFVGWKDVKHHLSQYYPSIVEKDIKGFPYTWEFGMDEKMTEHFNGIEAFVQKAPRKFIDKWVHVPIDPIVDDIKVIADIINIIGNSPTRLYFYKKEIIYVWVPSKGKIFSVFLTAFEYFGFNIDDLILLLKMEYTDYHVDNEGLIYQEFYRLFPDFDQLKRAIVIFL